MSEPLGARIKRIRLGRGLTLQAVADDLGLTPAAISHWESGRIKPRPKKLQDLARILKVDLVDLGETSANEGRPRTPMAEITDILLDAKGRIADVMGCAPEDVKLEWSIADRSGD